jgi:predicted amidophosphoribosyltransferase
VDFVKCQLCRIPFFSYGGRLCPGCQEQIDKDFIAVRDYIYDHPHQASVEEVATATGVSEKSIVYLLEEERLIATGIINASSGRCCQFCGAKISEGGVCEPCKASLVRDLDSAASALAAPAPEQKSPPTAAYTARSLSRDYYALSEYGKRHKN